MSVTSRICRQNRSGAKLGYFFQTPKNKTKIFSCLQDCVILRLAKLGYFLQAPKNKTKKPACLQVCAILIVCVLKVRYVRTNFFKIFGITFNLKKVPNSGNLKCFTVPFPNTNVKTYSIKQNFEEYSCLTNYLPSTKIYRKQYFK